MNSKNLLYAMEGIRSEFVEDTAAAMAYTGRRTVKIKKIWRTALIAAVIAALLTAAAYAAGLFGLNARKAELPPDSQGNARCAVIPNGFRDSDTFKGSAEWWSYVTEKTDSGEYTGSIDFSFARGDEELYSIANQYFACTEEMLDRLLEIAEKYDLELYRNNLMFEGRDDFYALTGAGRFIPDENLEAGWGYVFADGSFKLEGIIKTGGEDCAVTLCRSKSGSIYPYGRMFTEYSEAEELQFSNKRSQSYSVYPGSTVLISYVSPDGRTFIEINPYLPPEQGNTEEMRLERARAIADMIDFEALCEENREAEAVLEKPRGAEDNMEILDKLRDFQSGPVFRAAAEFQDFFTANFYGFSFTGTWGMKDCGDIDEELERLGEKYGLQYAKEKSTGNEFFPEAQVYDNGAWYYGAKDERGFITIQYHYIPKTALYTGLIHYCPIEEYARVWDYRTESGETVLLCSGGPDRLSAPYAFYETDSAYIICQLSSIDVREMEREADSIDWAAFSPAEEG
ncbi:MAG: hypothetical protein ACOX68_06125 [Candidatus Limivicinus sp.]|jgi:hypothetical protein